MGFQFFVQIWFWNVPFYKFLSRKYDNFSKKFMIPTAYAQILNLTIYLILAKLYRKVYINLDLSYFPVNYFFEIFF